MQLLLYIYDKRTYYRTDQGYLETPKYPWSGTDKRTACLELTQISTFSAVAYLCKAAPMAK